MKPYQLIWRMVLCRPWLYIANGIAWTLIHIAPVLPGLLVKEFFDTLTGTPTLDVGLCGIAALLVAVAAARIANIWVGARLDNYHRFLMSSLLRRNMMEDILQNPNSSSQGKSAGEIVNCFQDDARQAEDSISWTLDVIGSASFAGIAAFILVSLNARVTVFVFAPLIVIGIIAHAASSRLERYRRRHRDATSRVTEAIGEAMSGVQAIQVSGAELHVVRHLDALGEERRKAAVKDRVLDQVLDAVFDNTTHVGMGLVLLLASQSMRLGEFTVGDFALFAYYLGFVTEFAALVGHFMAHYRQTGVSFSRMTELMADSNASKLVEHKPLDLGKPTRVAPAIRDERSHLAADKLHELRVEGLTYHHANSGKGIEDVSFLLKRGEFIAVTGRIGSGKTTLLNALLGLIPETSGSIYWNGVEVVDPKSFFTPPRAAYTPQIPHLFSGTLRDNILLGLEASNEDLGWAVYTSVLEKDVRSFEKGLDTLIGPKGVRLSGGQQQRVAIARMLIRRPDLLVLDDVSSALDVETEKLLWERIYGLSPSSKRLEPSDWTPTCLVITNRRAVVLRADHAIVLKSGRVVAQGCPTRLLETNDELASILSEPSQVGLLA